MPRVYQDLRIDRASSRCGWTNDMMVFASLERGEDSGPFGHATLWLEALLARARPTRSVIQVIGFVFVAVLFQRLSQRRPGELPPLCEKGRVACLCFPRVLSYWQSVVETDWKTRVRLCNGHSAHSMRADSSGPTSERSRMSQRIHFPFWFHLQSDSTHTRTNAHTYREVLLG